MDESEIPNHWAIPVLSNFECLSTNNLISWHVLVLSLKIEDEPSREMGVWNVWTNQMGPPILTHPRPHLQSMKRATTS